MLLIPNCPLIITNAMENNMTLPIVTIILLGMLNMWVIIRANPVIPPLAILFGKKKNCSPTDNMNTPSVITAYSFIVFIILYFIFFSNLLFL